MTSITVVPNEKTISIPGDKTLTLSAGNSVSISSGPTGATRQLDNLANVVIVKFGGTAEHATTPGTAVLSLFDGTAPVGTLANGASLYSASGEMNVIDSAGNTTLLSPHDKDTNEWIFYSKNTVTGRVKRINMERLVSLVEKLSGETLLEEWLED